MKIFYISYFPTILTTIIYDNFNPKTIKSDRILLSLRGMDKKERWAVWMPCKGYVKRWLLVNYNRPDRCWPEIVDLSENRPLYRLFLNHLRRGWHRRDGSAMSVYGERVAIEISEDTFRRYGWELTGTELRDFNGELERQVKLAFHTHVSMLSVTGITLNESIRRFRRYTGIGELDWETDSMRKEVLRHVRMDGGELWREYQARMEEKVWAVLSENGLLSRQGADYCKKNQLQDRWKR